MAIEVYLDDREYSADLAASGTLGDLVEAVRAEVATSDRVIVGIVCDGIGLTDDLEAKLAEPLDRFRRVDLQSGRAQELVRDALEQALNVLADTDHLREQAIDALTRGDQTEATQVLGDCFRHWSQIHLGIAQSLAFLGLDPQTLEVNGQPLESALAGIAERLKEVREALQAGDNVLLADTLQYEFDEAAETWKAAIEAVLARTTQTAGA